jgi:hypothetical protein
MTIIYNKIGDMVGRGTNFPIFLHPDISQIFSPEEKDGGIFKMSGCKMIVREEEEISKRLLQALLIT